jgi:purine-nucleoside phosphorylase
MNYDTLNAAFEHVRAAWPDARPRCGLILGSGWSDVAGAFELKGSMAYEAIPGFGKPGVAGHSGKLSWGAASGLETFIFQGRRHWYEGEGWTPVAIPPYLLKKFGAATVVVTNAAGGINPDFKCGDLMVIDDHINNLASNPLMGPHDDTWGPRFPDQSAVYDPALRALLDAAAGASGVTVHHGVYIASSGPTYETPAEIRAFTSWGADAAGMSTVPEAILAGAAGMRVAGISCITNLAAGISPTPLSHEEVTEATRKAMPRMKALIQSFWEGMSR